MLIKSGDYSSGTFSQDFGVRNLGKQSPITMVLSKVGSRASGAWGVLILVFVIVSDYRVAAHPLVPVIPSIGASSFDATSVQENFGAKPTDMIPAEKVLIFDVPREIEIRSNGTFKRDRGADGRSGSWRQQTVCFSKGTAVVDWFSSRFRKMSLTVDSHYGAGSAASILHRYLDEDISSQYHSGRIDLRRAEDESALQIDCRAFAGTNTKPTDDDETISKVGNQKISEPRIVTKPSFWENLKVTTFGFALILGGLFLLRYENAIYPVGVLLVVTGISTAVYGPDIWFLWSAQ